MRVLRFISSARTWLAFGVLSGFALPAAALPNEAAPHRKDEVSGESVK
jgi:hypothetical protein